jgi:putative chitinase
MRAKEFIGYNVLDENFADGKVKGKSRPGRVKRSGASCNGSVTDLRKRAKNASGERAKMYHWCANMKSGRNESVEEGWKDWVAGAALGAAALTSQAKPIIVQQHVEPGDTVYSIARQNNVDPKEIMKLNNFNKDTKLKKGQMVKVPDYSKPVDSKPEVKKITKPEKIDKKLDISNTVTGTKHEAILRHYANKANIKGNELVAFLAQVAHETMDFKHMAEIGGSLDFKKYDIRFAPGKAKQLGNTEPGDGAKFKGRGYIQLTGRYNYAKAGEALGLPLEQKPELVEKPEIAAKVAIWYWKNRVKPNVDDFKDVKGVTKPINPGLKGLEDRKEKYQTYKVAIK